MINDIKVSIIIPCYQVEHYIEESIKETGIESDDSMEENQEDK